MLATINYEACVDFYTRLMELPVLFVLDNQHSKLTCCDMGGGGYLMIERSDSKEIRKEPSKASMWLRFNVGDIDAAVRELENKGLQTHIRREPWGTIADFTDPDGNRCSLRDENSFG